MVIDPETCGRFRLPDAFVLPYRARPVPWGYGALSWVIYKRTYSRDGEAWWETCRRVIEGMFTVQRWHCLVTGRPWDTRRAQAFATDAYERLWRFLWTPPGRGLWIMGTPFMYDRGGAALNSCGFVSTASLAADFAGPFVWMLRMSMLGVGVGFDTRGKGAVSICAPRQGKDTHTIADSREGWAEALARLLRAFVGESALPAAWDYAAIRPRGRGLASFGGVASGPAPLREMMASIEALHRRRIGRLVDAELIVDTMNLIGRCVVAGGVRRSAQIAFGDPGDTQFLDLKQDPVKLREYRWASNNSVFATVGMDYAPAARRSAVNGEPGYFWLENARRFGRMRAPANDVDAPAMGSNPCVEQTLWDRELCCLVETFPARHTSLRDYRRTLRLAYLYAKTVTLIPTEYEDTNRVMMQNRRIGCSMTGVVQAIARLGANEFFRWCDTGYGYLQALDREYCAWLAVPRSIKITSVKPSGSVSLLAGATPGVHWEHGPFYIRRVRVNDRHPLVELCRKSGYRVEPDVYSEHTAVIEFPVKVGGLGRGKADVPLAEKVELAARMQYWWSDNQVSCTADFDPVTEAGQLPGILRCCEARLKGIVFMPRQAHGYEQAPYEAIGAPRYHELAARLRPLRGEIPHDHSDEVRFCDGDVCEFGT